MDNTERNSLAKNRYIDSAVQNAIAYHGNRTALLNLCDNPSLTVGVRDELWSKRGYVLKSQLVRNGHYLDNPERYRDLYYGHINRWFYTHSGQWRLKSSFLSSYWHGTRSGYIATPSDILDDITNKAIKSNFGTGPHDTYSHRYIVKGLIGHPNLSVESCVKLTTVKDEENQKSAFERLVLLNTKGKNVSTG